MSRKILHGAAALALLALAAASAGGLSANGAAPENAALADSGDPGFCPAMICVLGLN